ncbi:MAG: exonuclease domain-containing protein [Sarcina sp.]
MSELKSDEFLNIDWDYEVIKENLSRNLEPYKNLIYNAENIKLAKADKVKLNKLKNSIEDKKNAIKKIYLEPFNEVDKQSKELIALVTEQIKYIDSIVKEAQGKEKEAKKNEIKEYFDSKAGCFGDFANEIFENKNFYIVEWENKGAKISDIKENIDDKINKISNDITIINESDWEYKTVLLDEYLKNLSIDDVNYKLLRLKDVENKSFGELTDGVCEYIIQDSKILKVSGSETNILKLINYSKILGLEIEELDTGIAKEMLELTEPSFDSFVAFDLETTGTFGANNGDGPAEITEIGAVKVVNGVVTERFSQLINPKRMIVPRIAQMTGITNDMLVDKPFVEEVILKFKEFVDDNVLVGHNIKSCDIPKIKDAAKRAGFKFTNKYFDTYLYAKQFKIENEWENVKLSYLSNYFGIQQSDAHRAWCDAQANMTLYFKLKDLI